MPKRSTRITLSNNTPYKLSLIGAEGMGQDGPCHGCWTDTPNGKWQPPNPILPKTHGSWQSESCGIDTGTEGWVKYEIQNTDIDFSKNLPNGVPCGSQLLWIAWDNPFAWDNTTPIYAHVYDVDVTVPCGNNAIWSFPRPGSSAAQICNCETFMAGVNSNDPFIRSVDWNLAIITWPVLEGLTFLGAGDINLEFTIALRQVGSVDQTIASFYDGSKGFRSLTTRAGQSSLRKLFHL